MTHAEGLALFVTREKRQRYRELLQTPSGRRKLLDRLNHNNDFDPRYLRRFANDVSADRIEASLRGHGAQDTCHVFSTIAAIDGKELRLRDALWETVSRNTGSMLSCIPGRLGYFESEDFERFLLIREG